MANRTIEIYGYAVGASACSANATFNGNVVFSGELETLPEAPAENYGLFTFEIPMSLAGTFPVTINFTGGTFAFVQKVMTNYMKIPNPIYSEEQFAIVSNVVPENRTERNAIMIPLAQPPLTAEEISILENNATNTPECQAILASHGISVAVSSGPNITQRPYYPPQVKTNVVVNGVALGPQPPPDGEWAYDIPIIDGQGVIAFDMMVSAGFE